LVLSLIVDRDSSVDIATRYWLDGWGSNPGGGEIFESVQTGPGAHPASFTMSTRSFPRVKPSDRGVNHPSPSTAELKERAELYLHSPSGLLWPVLG
jgi:hypothetical protein